MRVLVSSVISLVRAIATLRQKGWITNITWIPIENNLPVDMLVKSVDPYSTNLHKLSAPPTSLLLLLSIDAMHLSFIAMESVWAGSISLMLESDCLARVNGFNQLSSAPCAFKHLVVECLRCSIHAISRGANATADKLAKCGIFRTTPLVWKAAEQENSSHDQQGLKLVLVGGVGTSIGLLLYFSWFNVLTNKMACSGL
ncbi:hypothetical protein V6N11_072144 [Hibiscus sabdariffa]|uniref:RNase H type-1 domain-containing protein n=1 Tax=Hibiscus sabdariffa TaxID=183260 RepID=A0ABR2U260_9ROSI